MPIYLYLSKKCVATIRVEVPFFVLICHRPATQLSTTMPTARVLRDIKARKGVAAHEIVRRAYLMVARNETLSPQVRHHAQLQLNTFGRYTQPTTVRNRCHESGRGRGIISEFGLCRVCLRLALSLSCSHIPLVPISSQSTSGRTSRSSKGIVVG